MTSDQNYEEDYTTTVFIIFMIFGWKIKNNKMIRIRPSFWWPEKAIYDSEYRARTDISRNMKKMESDTAEYEVQLALAQRQFSEAQKNSKDFAIQLKDINLKNDEIIKKTEEARLESDAAQRRVALMTEEVDQLRYDSYHVNTRGSLFCSRKAFERIHLTW